jgi:ankyrin repeat protein
MTEKNIKCSDCDDEYGMTPLDIAVTDGNIDTVKLLISQGADVNVRDSDGNTPLHIAAEYGYINIAKLLISNRAKINIKNKDNETPLHIAAEKGHRNIVKLLLSRRANVNVRDNNRNTPLHIAVFTQHIDIARLLISQGADVHVRDREGDTPLHNAVRADRTDIVKLLISSGADVNIRNKNGNTPSDMTQDEEILNLLLPHDAEPATSTSLSTDLWNGNGRLFPTYDEFRQFLERNRKQKFDQGKYYTCAMSMYTDAPVGEGHSTDIDIHAPLWFKEFEKRTSHTRNGIWSGEQLLEVLNQIDADEPFTI